MSALDRFHHRFEPGTSGRTLLLLHGTGGNEDDLLPLGRQVDPSAALLSPRGQVLEHGMPRFFRRLAEGVFDVPDLVARAAELADFVGAAAGHYQLDRRQIVAVGYSNGANIASALLLLHRDVLAGAALIRPMVPLAPAELPDLSATPVLIAAGSFDPIGTPREVMTLTTFLRRAGAAVEVDSEPTGHQLTRATVERVRVWLASQFRHRNVGARAQR